MDELLSAVTALIFWRLVVSILGSIVLAVVLSNLFLPFTAEYCITLVIFGATFGMYWQGRADSGLRLTEQVKEREVSRPVAFIGLAFFGFSGGGFLGELFGSKVAGAVALILCAGITALWHRIVKQRPPSLGQFAFSTISLLSGYLTVLALSIWKAL